MNTYNEFRNYLLRNLLTIVGIMIISFIGYKINDVDTKLLVFASSLENLNKTVYKFDTERQVGKVKIKNTFERQTERIQVLNKNLTELEDDYKQTKIRFNELEDSYNIRFAGK
jgi:predicted RNase H-like nuclease (RuvC/YqgF family)